MSERPGPTGVYWLAGADGRAHVRPYRRRRASCGVRLAGGPAPEPTCGTCLARAEAAQASYLARLVRLALTAADHGRAGIVAVAAARPIPAGEVLHTAKMLRVELLATRDELADALGEPTTERLLARVARLVRNLDHFTHGDTRP